MIRTCGTWTSRAGLETRPAGLLAGAAAGMLQGRLAALGGLAFRLGDEKRAAAHRYGFIELIVCH
jgi:hypothetical protein